MLNIVTLCKTFQNTAKLFIKFSKTFPNFPHFAKRCKTLKNFAEHLQNIIATLCDALKNIQKLRQAFQNCKTFSNFAEHFKTSL